ncbi:MAG: glycoside hydrolase family 2 TIM barrel-domain containing protein [Ferruginibacter sp.]|nr:glycoside hydrolase family 2 TIM barrel-domain containing protein [Ferruginibacter sp.]
MKQLFRIYVICYCFLMPGLESRAQSPRQTALFNEGWKFYKGEVSNGESDTINDKAWRTVELPHDYSIEGPFSQEWASGTGFLPGGIGWYRKTFDQPAVVGGKKLFIYFDGVYKNSEVWLNGHLLGKHPNGYIPFQYDLTPHLKKGRNVLAVKVDHTKFADSRWYPGSGIYRNVYLVTKSPVHIDLWGTRFTTPTVSKQSATAAVTISVKNTSPATANIVVESKLTKGSSVVASAKKSISIKSQATQPAGLSLQVQQPALWSVDNPNLYTLTTTVLQNGKKVDEYTEEVGFRTIRFDANEGFFLNGENMKMKGVCIHHDAGALGAAVPREVWARRLEKLKEVGCNAIRMSHYPHQDYLYELCDSMGFLVQDEAFDEWEAGKNKWIAGWNVGKPGNDGYSEHFKDWAGRDLTDMIERNKNHPSIIMWSIGNEIDYPNDPYTHEILNTGRNPQIFGKGQLPDHPPASRLGEIAQQLVTIAKKADTTRPITAALAGVVMSNTTSYPGLLDLVGYNYQEYRYAEDHQAYPNRIIYGSENGKGADAWMAVDTSRNIFGQFLWTGFDFMGEAGRWPTRSSGAGLLNLAGFPKIDFYARQVLWVKKPVLHLVVSRQRGEQGGRGRRMAKPSWNWDAGDTVRISCLTNLDEAELFLNGNSLGRKSKSDTGAARLSWTIPYQTGELVVKGFTNGKVVQTEQLVTAGEAKSIVTVADKKYFIAGKKDLAHLEIMFRDAAGNLVYEAANELTVTVTGPAKLLGLEAGDLASHEDYRSNKRKAFNGKLLAYIQSTGVRGTVTVTITSPGLAPTTVAIQTAK